jgi:7-cyano-7-deazaguanine synthase in queuosine biosynthesis
MDKKITIANIDFAMPSCPKSILLSGGADSAILFYILMLYSEEPIKVYTCGSVNNNRQAPITAYNIINACLKRMDRRDVYQHVYYVDSKLSNSMFEVTNELTKNDEIVYLAFTNTPDDDVLETFKHENVLYNDRDPKIKNKPLYGTHNLRYYRPLINHNKKDVYKIYKELDALDWLFPITMSCESNTVDPSKHCDNCWWCEERRWAFGRLI